MKHNSGDDQYLWHCPKCGLFLRPERKFSKKEVWSIQANARSTFTHKADGGEVHTLQLIPSADQRH